MKENKTSNSSILNNHERQIGKSLATNCSQDLSYVGIFVVTVILLFNSCSDYLYSTLIKVEEMNLHDSEFTNYLLGCDPAGQLEFESP